MKLDIEEMDSDFEFETDPDEEFIWKNKNQSCVIIAVKEKIGTQWIKLRTVY